jgi:hypothetical protein
VCWSDFSRRFWRLYYLHILGQTIPFDGLLYNEVKVITVRRDIGKYWPKVTVKYRELLTQSHSKLSGTTYPKSLKRFPENISLYSRHYFCVLAQKERKGLSGRSLKLGALVPFYIVFSVREILIEYFFASWSKQICTTNCNTLAYATHSTLKLIPTLPR